MAADPKKATNDKKGKDEKAKDDKAPDAAADEGSKKKKKLLLLIGVAVGLIAISVGGTVLALKMLAPPSEDEEEEIVEETKILAPAIYQTMKPNFTINFNVNGRQRYLQAELTLMYRDATIEPLLGLHMPAIRNGLVMLFSSKNFDELQTKEGKDKLRIEALAIVQNLLIKEQEALAAANKDEDEDEEDEEDKDEEDKDEKDSKDAKKAPEYPNIEQVLFTNFVMQ